jgi:hypothetical protein
VICQEMPHLSLHQPQALSLFRNKTIIFVVIVVNP